MIYNKTLVFIAACIGMAFFGVAFIVMGAVLPSLTEQYALNSVGVSSLVTFLPVGVLFGSLIFGPIVDRFGYKILLIISTITLSFGIVGLSFLENLNLLRFCIFFVGLGGGMLNGATNALVSDITNDKERSSKLSILGVFYGLGALGVPLLLSTLSKFYRYQVILQWTGIFIILCVIYFIAICFPKPKLQQKLPIKHAFALIKDPLLLVMSFFLFFQSGLEGLFNNWTTSYLIEVTNIDEERIIFSLTFFVLGMTIARLILSYLLRKVNDKYVLLGGIFTSIFGVFLLSNVSAYWLIATGLFLIGTGLAAGFPIMISIIGTIYKETTGTAIGLALFIALTGNTFLNYVMGFVSKTFQINSFPMFLIILLIIQVIIVVTKIKTSIKN